MIIRAFHLFVLALAVITEIGGAQVAVFAINRDVSTANEGITLIQGTFLVVIAFYRFMLAASAVAFVFRA